MIPFKRIFSFITLLGFIGLSSAALAQLDSSTITLKWKPGEHYNGQDNQELNLMLKNIGQTKIRLNEHDLWFTALFPVENKKTSDYEILSGNGNLIRVRFNDDLYIKPQDSLQVSYVSKYPVFNISTVPNGVYFQHREDMSTFFAVDVEVNPLPVTNEQRRMHWSSLYDKNRERQVTEDANLILPTPKYLKKGKDKLQLANAITYWVDSVFEQEMENLMTFADQFPGVRFVEGTEKSQFTVRHVPGYGKEAYGLKIDDRGIHIEASEGIGVFYALQSLRSLLDVPSFAASEISLPHVEIKDEPRYTYRGFMLDISRNFKDKKTILKYLDLMSRYKLNTFHLHFIDDEGWRIEISTLPELTEIGANRSPLFGKHQGLQPTYGSGAAGTPDHYLSRADFVEILRYAKQRHITVVPEIETPGHARASIKAMEARYHRYIEKGDKAEAERYLLHDFEDKSVYSSAQYWNDNVMNVALPSVYTFISVVLDEFKSMYASADLELRKVSLGGDEVPEGAWEKSPKIKMLMDSLGTTSVYDVWPYYIKKVNALCQEKGLQLVGWEEMGMMNKGKGMEVNPGLASSNIQLDVWNNLIGGGQEDLAYRLANAGYPTVYISANNNYFDMAWDNVFEEPGLRWASYADLYQSYTFLPEHFFASIAYSINGAKYEKGYFSHKVRLNEKGKSNLVGIKGGTWAETIVSEERLDYMVFPRLFSLAERAWSPRKPYEDENKFDIKPFNKDYSSFLNKVGKEELPKIQSFVKFRLPAVGVREEQGKLYANTEYPGFDVYYTVDGNIPTRESSKYSEPVSLEAGKTYKFTVIDKTGRHGTVSVIKSK
ncbi:family 20 glycosylhydrolase [Sphingobacterium phlebotomi]|uniref:beta-N-acetylhexosaminidase n=1 Tax=Sphingobacterium phlebotomi TaxID=2605433 RepID=A0A5D4H2D5_9SPHI|nr:family 20 glycosylhydrolase [Sphingobacterium phlebotomi]TYR34442.1 family 20 glycosylhydrolase [Sphingobacterium phlebotomi]